MDYVLGLISAFANAEVDTRVPGRCYLLIVRPEFRVRAFERFHDWPRVVDLLTMNWAWVIPLADLRRLTLGVVGVQRGIVGGRWMLTAHVESGGESLDDGRRPVVELLAAVAQLCQVRDGTLGWLVKGERCAIADGVVLPDVHLGGLLESANVNYEAYLKVTSSPVGFSTFVGYDQYLAKVDVPCSLARFFSGDELLAGVVTSSASTLSFSEGNDGVSGKTLLNRAKRQRARERKVRKKARQALGETPVTDLRASVEIVPVERSQVAERSNRDGEKKVPGFWNSCSPEVRQRLIDSKAEMHIAENLRKTKEAEDRVAYLNSPQAIMDKVIKLAEKAQAAAEKENNGRVFGWAKTVATSSAESLARSTPESIPSFDTFDEEKVKSLVEAEQEKTAAVRQEMVELEKEMHDMMDRHAHETKKLQDALAKAVDDKVKKARAEENKAPERLPGESPKAHFQRTQRMRAAKRAEVESQHRIIHQNVPGGFDWSDVPDRVMGF